MTKTKLTIILPILNLEKYLPNFFKNLKKNTNN